MKKQITEIATNIGIVAGTAILSVIFTVPMTEMLQYSMLALIVKIALNQQE